MTSVPIDQKRYEMPPREGITVTHFITVAGIDRSADMKRFRRPHSEQTRQQGRTWLHSDREYVAPCQHWGRAHPGQAVDYARGPRRTG